MTGRGKTLLSDATREEQAACIRLFALSVVQHRAKRDFVAIRDSAEFFRPKSGSKEKAELFMKSRDLIEEAMEMVRAISAETPPKTEEETQSEKRNQLRIDVTAPLKIRWPGSEECTNARLQNISWGGASIIVDQANSHSGDTLQVLLPGIKSSTIKIEAKVLRTWELSANKGEGIAVRFSSLATTDQDEFEEVLKLLAQTEDNPGLRQHARLTQRLDIQFAGPDELNATLDDISAGGLGVTVPDPLQIGQSLEAVISTLDEGCTLKLRARVVRLEPIKMGKVELYHAGLKFEHPSRELNNLTRELIVQLAGKQQ
ncbi:PilZ domain-containing protein [Shewanella sp.]|uniref:PilZ domain-containing protein n=1 Tax=Shewanella sp. TaxID=50422 RepID=UPI004053ECBB